MLHSLANSKNLLAFSAGVDSSALFFMLIEQNIPFDIALVNYQTRETSNQEEEHAKRLAKKYNLKCFTTKAPKFVNNFEKNARDFRYKFFYELIEEYNYDNLLTAHQLNDQLEWFLMRLSKGAGLNELIGLHDITNKDNYKIIRPLLEYTKSELIEYLNNNSYPYFLDNSNESNKYERNRIRKEYSNKLIEQFSHGIKKSFEYMKIDKELLNAHFHLEYKEKSLRVIKLQNKHYKVRAIDVYLKELGYLLSASQREEVSKSDSIVIGGKWAIELQNNIIYIAPFKTINMPKEFKEDCRIKNIPSKIRPYLFSEDISLNLTIH